MWRASWDAIPSSWTSSGVVRATVESIAESTVDGVTAPLFFALIAGPVGAMVYRAINTLDSMFGHQDERYAQFGSAAARIDDLANYLPAAVDCSVGVSGGALVGQRPWRPCEFSSAMGESMPAPMRACPRPRWPALGVELGGVNFYAGEPIERPRIGDPLVPLSPGHIPAANAIMWTTAGLFLALGLSLRLASVQLWSVWRAAA